MRVGDVQVSGIDRRELAAERSGRLGGKGRSFRGRQPSILIDYEAVDAERTGHGGADLDPDEVRTRRVEENVTRVGRARQRDRGILDGNQTPPFAEPETCVVAAGTGRLVAFVGHVDEVAVDGDADRLDAA